MSFPPSLPPPKSTIFNLGKTQSRPFHQTQIDGLWKPPHPTLPMVEKPIKDHHLPAQQKALTQPVRKQQMEDCFFF